MAPPFSRLYMSDIAVTLPTHDQFAAVANSLFNARLDDGSTAGFSLDKVSGLNENGVTRAFSLTFRAPGDVPAEQSIYQFSHETLGAVELFLVPVRRDSDSIYFESIFNQLVAADG